jgi:hypothetical protein
MAEVGFFFRTHFWDAYAARMADAALEQFGPHNFFISADHSNRPFECGSYRVIPHTVTELSTLGLPARPLERTMWYNADYAFFDAYLKETDFDFYIFSEYDVKFKIDFISLRKRMISKRIDLYAPNFERVDATWPHFESTSPYYQNVFRILPVFTIISRRLIKHLYDRRLELGRTLRPDMMWPYCESFIASEAVASNFVVDPMLDFFLTRHCHFAPPMLEPDAANLLTNEIRHPVVSQERYDRYNSSWPRRQIGRRLYNYLKRRIA